MHQIDFSILDGEQFEELCEDLFKAMGFDDPLPERSGRGPDGGKDLIVSEKRESGVLGAPRRFKWLVECKNFAKSGKSVRPDDVGSITDKLVTHDADGYLLVTSTGPSINVATTIKSIDESDRFNFEATCWAGNRLIDEILKHRHVLEKYFPTSATVFPPTSHWSKHNPFLELFPYEDSQSSYFFGRQTEVTEVIERIYQQNFILLYGESGVGKTSLSQAGILPILRNEGTIAVVRKVDGSINLASLLDSIKSLLPENVKYKSVGNNSKDDSSLLHLAQIAEELRKQDLRLTIFFDQFETIFQEVDPNTKQIGQLFSEIASHIKAHRNISVVFSLRADYLDEFGAWTTEHKIPELWQNSYPIRKLSREQAINVLTSVPKHVSAKFSDDLIELIVNDLQNLDRGRIYPPNLQIVASQIFEQARGSRALEKKDILEIGLEHYEEIGGTAGVLESFLSDKLDELGADRDNAHKILLSLVRSTGVRTAVSIEHLSEALSLAPKKVKKLIRMLMDARLIKTTETSQTYELIHDIVAEKVLESTDETQKKIKSIVEAFQISLQTWQNEGIFESRNKLDMFYQYRNHLDLDLVELWFLILSENKSHNIFSNDHATRNRYFRWLESNPTSLNIRLLEKFLEAFTNEEIGEKLLESAFMCYCRIPDIGVQKELVSFLERIACSNVRAIYEKTYQTSTIPNPSTVSYLQELAVNKQVALELRTSISYRILYYYEDKFLRVKNSRDKVPQKNSDAIIPLKLLNSLEFQEKMFEFVKPDDQIHLRNAYKIELIRLLYKISPERTVNTLWSIVQFEHFWASKYKEFLKLLRLYDPNKTIDHVVCAIRDHRKEYHLRDAEVELLVAMDSEQADALLIEDLHEYCLRFPRGSKQFKEKVSKNYRGSLLIILKTISIRQLDTATTYLEKIIVGYEPEKLKHGCFDALCSIQKYIPNPDIFIFLLEDRFAKVRRRASRYILETIDYDETFVTNLSQSIMNQQEQRHKFQPTRYDALRSKIQTLCKLRLSEQSSTKRRIDILKHLANNDHDSQIKELASNSLKQL